MKSTSNVYRFTGLIAVLGLFTLLAGLIVMILLPDIRLAAWGLLVLGLLLLATAFIIDYRRVGRALVSRRGRFSTGTTVMASIFIGIILFVNAISIGNYHRFDVTGVAQFTLTSQTKEVLGNLKIPVQVLCFFVPDDSSGAGSYAASLLDEYQNYTDQLKVRTIDPDEHPDQARQYGITYYQTVVFETEKGYRLVSPQEILEQAEYTFTSAILEVTGVVQKKVYFLIGHDEATISEGYSYAKQGLLDNLYKVDTVHLLITHRVPEDATALIIPGPQKPLDKSEVEIIQNYLKDGGWVMILINPDFPQEIGQLLSQWGVEMEEGTVIDPSSYLAPNMASPIVPQARDFFGLSTTYFPGATAIIPQEGYTPTVIAETLQIYWTNEKTKIELHSLVRTSQDSWLEKDFDPDKKPEFNEGLDLKGPLNIGFCIFPSLPENAQEPPPDFKPTRIVVFGDSDFASNQHFYSGNNGELFLNLVNLLTAGKELISIERKVLPYRRLVIGPEAENFITYSSIGLLPLVVLAIGGIIWWRRR